MVVRLLHLISQINTIILGTTLSFTTYRSPRSLSFHRICIEREMALVTLKMFVRPLMSDKLAVMRVVLTGTTILGRVGCAAFEFRVEEAGDAGA